MISKRRRDSVGGGGSAIHFVSGALLHFGHFKKGAPYCFFWDCQQGGPSLSFLGFSKGGGPGPPGPPLNRPLGDRFSAHVDQIDRENQHGNR